jgi:hypothetical protein
VAAEAGLPRPAAAGGSVTGMPNPGVAVTRPAASAAQAADTLELTAPIDAGEIAPVDPATQAMPIEGPPVMLPDSTMSEDPTAAPPPAEAAASTIDPNAPRQ